MRAGQRLDGAAWAAPGIKEGKAKTHGIKSEVAGMLFDLRDLDSHLLSRYGRTMP